MDKPLPDHGSPGRFALPETSESKGGAKRPAEPLPQRKKLPHEIPSWVEQGSRHFITINCKNRNGSPLLENGTAKHMLESACFYDESDKWYLWLILVMPDHVHFIATFDLSRGLKKTIRAWKGYLTRTLGIEWQSDFFEHRLRNHSEFDEKAHYIRMNPVRAGLINRSEEWPYILDRISTDGGSPGRFALPETSESKGGAKRPAELK